MTYLLLNSKIVPRFTTIYFIVIGTKKLFKTRYLLWFISQKTQITLLAKKQTLHLVTILQATIKLAFTPIDLSVPRWLILFKPKVRYQTHQKWLKIAHQAQQALLKATSQQTLHTPLNFYCQKYKFEELVYKFYKFNADHLIDKFFTKFWISKFDKFKWKSSFWEF